MRFLSRVEIEYCGSKVMRYSSYVYLLVYCITHKSFLIVSCLLKLKIIWVFYSVRFLTTAEPEYCDNWVLRYSSYVYLRGPV